MNGVASPPAQPEPSGRPGRMSPGRPRPAGRALRSALALVALGSLLVSVGCRTTDAPTDASTDARADSPAGSLGPAHPGALVSATPIDTSVDGPPQTKAWRIAYHSRSADDRDITVTGLLLVPETPPPGGAPLIAWAHPTTGNADACAPSAKGLRSLPEQLIGRGYAVVATDYEGLGTPGPHPYLVGASEGHAVLDAARAATQVDRSGVEATSPIIVWGFSQGGHAASFAGELAPSYAPELPIKGVIAAAPVSDVAHFARRAEDLPNQFGVLVTIVGGFVAAHPELDPSTVFTPAVVDQMPELERQCIGEINEFFDRPLDVMRRARATERPDFAARFAENAAGLGRIPVPMLVVQGAKDDIVDPADTAAFVQRVCRQGTPVSYVLKPDTRHGVMDAEPYSDWITGRLANEPVPSTC